MSLRASRRRAGRRSAGAGPQRARVRGDERVPVHLGSSDGRPAAPRSLRSPASSRDEAAAMMALVQDANVAVAAAFHPDGINVGANIGRAAGAGVPGHVHVHVLPRWVGDTNFMTTVAEARVLPESLADELREAPGRVADLSRAGATVPRERRAPRLAPRRAPRPAPRGSRRHRVRRSVPVPDDGTPPDPGDHVPGPRGALPARVVAVEQPRSPRRRGLPRARRAVPLRVRVAVRPSTRPKRSSSRRGRSASRSVTRARSWPGTGSGPDRCGASCSTAPTRRPTMRGLVADRRRRRHRHGRVHRAEPRGLVEVRRSPTPEPTSER